MYKAAIIWHNYQHKKLSVIALNTSNFVRSIIFHLISLNLDLPKLK